VFQRLEKKNKYISYTLEVAFGKESRNETCTYLNMLQYITNIFEKLHTYFMYLKYSLGFKSGATPLYYYL